MKTEAFQLKDKVILVTGASGDIGRQVAITISEAGANVILTGRDKEQLTKTMNMLIGEGHKMIVSDLTSEEDINVLAQQCTGLNGVVHSAGMAEFYPTKFINRKKIDNTFIINFYAPVLLMTALFKHKKIKEEASIVFISSFSSNYPFTNGALYSSSKAALESYSKVLASEHRKIKLRSNSVAPAMIKTKILESAKIFAETISTNLDEVESQYLLGYGEPVDVANIILFLLSDASKWVTGQKIT